MIILYLSIGWFLGIWMASLTSFTPFHWLIPIVSTISALLWQYRQKHLTSSLTYTQIFLLLSLGISSGGWRYTTAVPQITPAHIAYYNDTRNITLTGLVTDEPDIHDRFINLQIAVDEITLPDGTTQTVTGKVLVRTYRFPIIKYGTEVQLNGRLEVPPENESFSYKDYLARQDIHSLIALPQLTILAENKGNPLYKMIFSFKEKAQQTIRQLLPDPQAALLTGILLGNDNGLPPDLVQDFQTTGMTHIIAISGANIALLVGILIGVGQRFLSRRGAIFFALIGIFLYTILVGADGSVVRAAVMGSIYVITNKWLGRPTYTIASLCLTGLLMTLFNPFTLWDVGFQLSFTATLSLMIYATPFTQWSQQQLTRWLEIRFVSTIMGVLSEAVIITIAAQILTLPLMMATFGQLSLIAFPANFIILPAQTAVMIVGGLATLLGMILPFIGQLLGWVVWLFLTYTILLVRAFATVPIATIPVALSTTAVLLLYALIFTLTWWTKQPAAKRQQVRATLAHNLNQRVALSTSLTITLLTLSWGGSQPDGHLHILFLDVGQGDATFIQTPSGRQLLIDGGFYPSMLNDQLGRQMPFWDRTLDLIIATHPDADHVAGLAGVWARYQVGQLITNGAEFGESAIYDAVLTAAEGQQTPIHHAQAGEVIVIEDGVRLEVLHPNHTFQDESRNENSVSMRLVYGNFTFLFTGDAEQKAEQHMATGNAPLTARVFKAGHHGSKSSSNDFFLAQVQPHIIVVSAGADNRFGHPNQEMLQRAHAIGATILRTDELGTIEVISDGQRMWWQAGP